MTDLQPLINRVQGASGADREPKRGRNTWLNRATCRVVGHPFVAFADGFKRRCIRCNREEWVMTNPYPRIGQAKHEWVHMDFEGRF